MQSRDPHAHLDPTNIEKDVPLEDLIDEARKAQEGSNLDQKSLLWPDLTINQIRQKKSAEQENFEFIMTKEDALDRPLVNETKK